MGLRKTTGQTTCIPPPGPPLEHKNPALPGPNVKTSRLRLLPAHTNKTGRGRALYHILRCKHPPHTKPRHATTVLPRVHAQTRKKPRSIPFTPGQAREGGGHGHGIGIGCPQLQRVSSCSAQQAITSLGHRAPKFLRKISPQRNSRSPVKLPRVKTVVASAGHHACPSVLRLLATTTLVFNLLSKSPVSCVGCLDAGKRTRHNQRPATQAEKGEIWLMPPPSTFRSLQQIGDSW